MDHGTWRPGQARASNVTGFGLVIKYAAEMIPLMTAAADATGGQHGGTHKQKALGGFGGEKHSLFRARPPEPSCSKTKIVSLYNRFFKGNVR